MKSKTQVATKSVFLDCTNGSCHTPIGAYSDIYGDNIILKD